MTPKNQNALCHRFFVDGAKKLALLFPFPGADGLEGTAQRSGLAVRKLRVVLSS